MINSIRCSFYNT